MCFLRGGVKSVAREGIPIRHVVRRIPLIRPVTWGGGGSTPGQDRIPPIRQDRGTPLTGWGYPFPPDRTAVPPFPERLCHGHVYKLSTLTFSKNINASHMHANTFIGSA